MQYPAATPSSSRPESIGFSILLVISLLPLLLTQYFPTLDGPAHLYNARLIRELFTGNELVAQYFQWNSTPEPNWSGHLIMALLGSVFSATQTLKILLALIIILTATGFRKLFSITAPGQPWVSWMLFPWLWNFPLMMGFLNYSFGLALFPWIIFKWIRYLEQPGRNQFAVFFLLLTLSYFSHLMLFGITLIMMGILALVNQERVRSIKRLLLISAPFVLAGLFFIASRGTAGMHDSYNRLPWDELFQNFTWARPLIIFHMDNEKPVGQMYALFFLLVLILSLFTRQKNQYTIPVVIFTLLLIVLHFFFPDDFAAGGIITVRIAQLTFLSFIWLIAVNGIPKAAGKFIAIGSVIFMTLFYSKHHQIQRDLSADAQLYVEASSHIPQASVVMPLNYSWNWLHSNIYGFAGASHDLVFLDNYEADMLYFPLHWKKQRPEITHGNFAASNRPCIQFEKLNQQNQLPDAILCWQMPSAEDSCSKDVLANLELYYKQVFENSAAKVFLRK